VKKRSTTACSSNRSRFLLKAGVVPDLVVNGQTDEPAVQQVVRTCSINWRSLRTEKKTWTSMARSSFSGAMEARPLSA
jgi:hypothetical protein